MLKFQIFSPMIPQLLNDLHLEVKLKTLEELEKLKTALLPPGFIR